ncbi:MAG: DNA-processing protein DprA [Bullifex sp.]|nr:DNA-processing protein DprA [Bullifex sp.]
MRKNENEALLYETLYALTKKNEEKAFMLYGMVALKCDISRTLPEIIYPVGEVTGFSSFELSETYYRIRNAFSSYRFEMTILKEGDPSWPSSLRNTGVHFLYMVGRTELLAKAKVAVRGFRVPTEEGKNAAIMAMRDVKDADGAVITTADTGLDHYAAAYALSEGIPLIIVLSSPLHMAVPEAAKELLVSAANGNGLLVSQFPPHIRAEKWFAVPRNRLLLSLADHFVLAEEKDGGPLFAQAETFLSEKGRVMLYDSILSNPAYTYARKLSETEGTVILRRKGDLRKILVPQKKSSRRRKDDDQPGLFDL